MASLDLVNQENKKVGKVDLNDQVFAAKVNVALVHQVIKAQLAGRRQGTHCTKTKAEVRGGGKKPYKQKGTGSARRGSQRSPIMVGGGQSHGPRPRSYEQATPKEMMRGALRSALSDRMAASRIIVVDQIKMDQPKTKTFSNLLSKNFKIEDVLIVDNANSGLERSGRNIAKVKILRTEGLNVYDIVDHSWLMITKQAVEVIEKRLAQ